MLASMIEEIRLRKSYLGDLPLESIYLGGGSPSLLQESDLASLLNEINKNFVLNDPEITLEANPDDLSKDKLQSLKSLGINRLSIGVQSFRDEDLKLFNRAHTAHMALQCLNDSKAAGFENITMDLIYGIPGLSLKAWKKNLDTFFEFNLPHLSAYALTYEEKTAFGHWIKKGKLIPSDENLVIDQFKMLMEMASKNGFEHYEISNFAQNHLYAKHNTSYWKGDEYLGIGPSAHSYDGATRCWNVANNSTYLRNIKNGDINIENEKLSKTDKLNEYIMTSLRTMWGLDLSYVKRNFGSKEKGNLILEANPYIQDKSILIQDDLLLLSEKGKLVADKITSDLFQV